MKNKRIYVCLLLIVYLFSLLGGFNKADALSTGEEVLLKTDYECKSLVQFWLESEGYWSFKVIHYVYYNDIEIEEKYPAFCIEPKKEGIGIKYNSYNTSIEKASDNVLWRILSKGYMGKSYQECNLESDDDLYTATLIAIHSYKENINPKGKYRVGIKGIDGLTLEEVQRRGSKVLDLAEELYNYGLNGKEIYEEPKIYITKNGKEKDEVINGKEYIVYEYKLEANKKLESYNVKISDFTEGTLVLDMNNKEKSIFNSSNFKIAIPIDNINKEINGVIKIENAKVKTCPIFYCKSLIQGAQSYVTYTSGYEQANGIIDFNLKSNNCILEIVKKDEEGNLVEGVKFKLFDKEKKEIGEYVTDKNGKINIKNLEPKEYYIKEVFAPFDYKINDKEFNINLKWGKTVKIDIENEFKKGSLEILKVDLLDEKNTLEGVEFDLFNEKNEKVGHIVTDKDGKAKIENLNKGQYILKETKTQKEYVLDEKEYKIEIKPGEITKKEITNELKKGSLEILKVDLLDEKNTLEGVEFDLFNEKNEKVDHIVTDKDGKAKIENLNKGQYILKETKTQKEYVLDEKEYKIEIKPGEITKKEITNEFKKGSLEILKVDELDEKIVLEGVEFDLFDENNKKVGHIITDKDGKAKINDLSKGKYLLKEVKTKDEYILDKTIYEIEIKPGKNFYLKIENEKKPEPKIEIEIPKLPKTGF